MHFVCNRLTAEIFVLRIYVVYVLSVENRHEVTDALSFALESSGGWSKDEVRPLIGVGTFEFPSVLWLDWLIDWVKVLHPTRYKIGLFGDVLRSQSFGLVLNDAVVGWPQTHSVCKNCFFSPKVLFWNKWGRKQSDHSDQLTSSLGKQSLKQRYVMVRNVSCVVNYLVRPHQGENWFFQMRPWSLEGTKCPCKSLSWTDEGVAVCSWTCWPL